MAKNVLLLNDPDNSLGEIQEAIQKAGYTAYMTDNSDDAIELFEKIEGKFCLLSLKAWGRWIVSRSFKCSTIRSNLLRRDW